MRDSLRQNPDVQAWIAEAREVPLLQALRSVSSVALKKSGQEQAGPCPACGGTDRFSIAGRKHKWNCRGAGGGHDAIGLVMHVAGLEFFAACEILTGRANPAGQAMSEAERAALRRQSAICNAHWQGRDLFYAMAEAGQANSTTRCPEPGEFYGDADLTNAFAAGWRKAADDARRQERYRDQAIREAQTMWQEAEPFARSILPHYFAHRGIYALPPGICLRLHPNLPLFGEKPPDAQRKPVLHTGPAMLSPILDESGALIGVHRTWLSWNGEAFTTEKGTLAIIDPVTGEPAATKKAHGSTRGLIPLGGGTDPDAPLRLRDASRIIGGEGRETTLALAFRMMRAGADLSGTAFASFVDLGRIGGRALDRVRHPEKNRITKTGRPTPLLVPGREPDMRVRGIKLPVYARELVLLKDGDSDPFETENALQRGARRFMLERQADMARGAAHHPLTVRIADAPAGMDFDDFNRATLGCGDSRSAQHGSPHEKEQVAA